MYTEYIVENASRTIALDAAHQDVATENTYGEGEDTYRIATGTIAAKRSSVTSSSP
jgi:hypothetical protein